MKAPTIVVIAIALFGVQVGYSAPAAADGPPPLPQEAFDACAQKRSGDACVVTFKQMEIHGVCTPSPRDNALFCRPDGPPPGR